jgi:cation diffusion facilitator CzcD-associated flavoprotein CzcO
MPNWHYSRWGRALRRRVPALTRLSYRYNQRTMDSFFGGLLVPGRRRAITQWACRANLKRVRDPELRAKLTPDYQAGCKRLVVSWDYYPAIQRPDVELVTEKIERVEARGIRTADGRLHELDAIALATGFDAQAYVRPMRLTGLDGHTLDEAWTRAPAAHLTVSVPNFPNFFLLMGPNSPIGNTSLVPIAEAQADLVARFVERMARGELRTVAARAEAAEAFRRALAERMPDTVWVTGCSSWYLADDGVPTLWPYTPREFYERLAAAPDEDFVLTGAAES